MLWKITVYRLFYMSESKRKILGGYMKSIGGRLGRREKLKWEFSMTE